MQIARMRGGFFKEFQGPGNLPADRDKHSIFFENEEDEKNDRRNTG
jgi:hypothetical protein